MHFCRIKKKEQQLSKDVKREDAATERIRRINEEQKRWSNAKNVAKKAESTLRQQKLIEKECNRRIEIKNKIEYKLNEAAKRKQVMGNEFKVSNMLNKNEVLQDGMANAKQNYYRNIRLYQMQVRLERSNVNVI